MRIPSTNACHSNKEKNDFHEAHNCATALGLNHQKINLDTESKFIFPV